MRIRLYFDEDSMQHGVVRALRARGVEVLTALEAGMIEQPDAAHLEYAAGRGRALCSSNVGDYYRLHREYLVQGKTHAGIILLQLQTYSAGEQLRRFLKLIADISAAELENTVQFLSNWA